MLATLGSKGVEGRSKKTLGWTDEVHLRFDAVWGGRNSKKSSNKCSNKAVIWTFLGPLPNDLELDLTGDPNALTH